MTHMNRQTEESSGESYSRLFEKSPAIFLIVNPDTGEIVDANESACSFYGYSKDDLKTKKITEINILSREEIFREMENARSERRKHFIFRHRLANGEIRDVEVYSGPVEIGGRECLFSIVHDISERRRMEDELRQKTMELEKAQRIARLGSWDWDARTDAITWTDELYRIFDRDSSLPTPNYEEHLKLYTPESAKLLSEAVERAMQAGESYELDLERAGNKGWVTARGEVKRDANGQIIGLRGTAQDITERKLVEKALHKANIQLSLFRTLMDNSSDGIEVLDPVTLFFLDVSEKECRDLGYSREEMLSMRVFDIDLAITEDSAKKVVEQLREIRTTRFETIHRRKDGSTFPVEISLGYVELERSYLISMVRDISERKQAEEELHQKTIELEEAQRIGQIGSWKWDPKSGQVMWSDELYRIFGLDSKLPAPTLDEQAKIYSPESMARLRAAVNKALHDGTSYDVELDVVRGDGSIRLCIGRGRADLDVNGGVGGLHGTLQDITELKQAEAEIKKLNEELEYRVVERTAQLETANKELEAFSYSISHDLRSPLRAIAGFSQIVAEDYLDRLDEEGRRKLGHVIENVKKMEQLIDDLLAFSRMGRKEMMQSEIDMKGLANAVLDELSQLNPGRSVQIELKELPNAYGDPAMLKQVYINLLSNAFKFTRTREMTIIEVGWAEPTDILWAQPSDQNVYYVRDNGVGFDMNYANKLFSVFQRLHNSSEFEGTGVGLALVQRIINRHGGRVWAEGKVGEGATFYFSLPREKTAR